MRIIRSLAHAVSFLLIAELAPAEDGPSARVVKFHNYDQAIELVHGDMRAVLCPQAGGRVLEFSVGGKQALWLDEKEKEWTPDAQKPVMSAGRFDYGPELVVAPHPTIWSGAWTAEITGTSIATLTSPRDEAAGVQLVRHFQLIAADDPRDLTLFPTSRGLACVQTIQNIGDKPIDVCHWGRSFSPGGGIAFVPLGDQPSRFPSKYAMYEDSAIINVRNQDAKICERDGFLEILGPPRKPKLGFDTYAGWLAYLMPNDVLFVKYFSADPDRVYNEAAGLTLSVWYPEGPRIELEPIGPRERLQPGESAAFFEIWSIFDFDFPQAGETVDLKKLRQIAEPKADFELRK
jgi:hypothetical protein